MKKSEGGVGGWVEWRYGRTEELYFIEIQADEIKRGTPQNELKI